MLPGEAFVESPDLSFIADYLKRLMTGDPSRQLPFHFNLAEVMISANDLKTRLSALTDIAITCRFNGELQQAEAASIQARNILESSSASSVSNIQDSLPFLRLQWGLTFYLSGHASSVSELEAAYTVANFCGHAFSRARSANGLAWLFAERGWISKAQFWIERAQECSKGNMSDPLHFLALGLINADRGEVDSALQHLNTARRIGVGDWWAQEAWVRSLCVHNIGEGAVVESYAREAQECHRSWPDDSPNMRLLRAADARLLTVRARSRVFHPSAHHRMVVDDLIDATVDLARGKRASALDICIACEDSAYTFTLRQRAQLLTITAAAAYGIGRVEMARSAFFRAHALIMEFSLATTYDYVPEKCYSELFQLIGEAPSVPRERLTLSSADIPALTRREREILTFLLTPMTIPEIAAELFISTNTVKTIVKHLYRKMGVTSRKQASDNAQLAGIRPAVVPARETAEVPSLVSQYA